MYAGARESGAASHCAMSGRVLRADRHERAEFGNPCPSASKGDVMIRKPVFVWGLIVSAAAIALNLTATGAEACCGGGCGSSCGSTGCGSGCGGCGLFRGCRSGCGSSCCYSSGCSSCSTCTAGYGVYYGNYAATPVQAAPVNAGTTYAPVTSQRSTFAPFRFASRTRVLFR